MKHFRLLLALFVASIGAVQSVSAQDEEQTITVSLRESGGLATEIFAAQANLGYEQSVASVVNLTVTSGELNDADWVTIKSMNALKNLDLGGTSNKALPAEQFHGCCGNLETFVFPSKLESIGVRAFTYNPIVTAILPSTLKSVGNEAFAWCPNLTNVGTWPSGATTIPVCCFDHCYNLQSFTIPEGVTTILGNAFHGCKSFSSTIPSTVKIIGEYAFSGSAMQDIDVVLQEGVSLGNAAFSETNIRSIVFPSTYYITYHFEGSYIYSDSPIFQCNNLRDVTIMSPTVLTYAYYEYGLEIPESVTIHVPDYLVYAYKSDPYFYKFNIEGFDITQYDIVWPFNRSFTLNAYTRMAGEPKISLAADVTYKITGTEEQKFGDITMNGNLEGGWVNNHNQNTISSMILSTCDNVSVTGDYYYKVFTRESFWFFICLPFDVDLSAITTDNGAKYSIRYYDGASRAYNNSSEGNWKNFAADAVIPAGTGFIYQTSRDAWTTFKAVRNDSRNNVFKNEELITALAANSTAAEGNTSDAANKGWNLVGNPWQCYYNIQKMNYAAPICVYDRWNETYIAYSIQDDELVLEPNQAFFVQCPDALNSIGFPADGRQLTSEIINPSHAPRMQPAEKSRWLVDVQIENGAEQKDKTRIVVNDQAKMDYEIGLDASKFMNTSGKVPQIYTLDAEATQYAINERPLANGTLKLGILIKEDGQYTISAIRNDLSSIVLTDHETGATTDLTQSGYSFNASAGSYESRFTLSFLSGVATGLAEMEQRGTISDETIYTLSGQRVGQPQKGLYIVGNKKVLMK